MGRLIFVVEEKVLLNYYFLISSTSAPKNKSKRRALFSESDSAYERLLLYGWVWGCEGKKSQYTHWLHHWTEGWVSNVILSYKSHVRLGYLTTCFTMWGKLTHAMTPTFQCSFQLNLCAVNQIWTKKRAFLVFWKTPNPEERAGLIGYPQGLGGLLARTLVGYLVIGAANHLDITN